uniref:Superoxide dismutase n=1 Tax=Geloina erosa TaxID=182730 RepID=A0A7D7PNQ6_9BIVA|nr:manganese superoxide dismutase [Geloina erosa]
MLSSKSLQVSRLLPKALGAAGTRLKHTLPALPYEYNALEPVISGEIMHLHHEKHHNTYVNNLNTTEEALAEAMQQNDVGRIISLQPSLKFNGGGHINHAIFWKILSPKGGGEPKGDLMNLIKDNFGSFDEMKSELTKATVAIQGSGWGWLGWNQANGRLQIATCANQDPLQPTTGLVPLFGIDVWEHAYYLQYKNVRPDYVKAIFDVANWEEVGENLARARLVA